MKGDGAKKLKEWERLAESQGWRIRRGGGGHPKWLGPCGQLVTMPSTPGRGRAIDNARATLRRNGLVVN